MKLKLLFKQAIRDFSKKMQLYLSFMVFILISIALIIGLFSFNLTLQTDYQDIANSTAPLNASMQNFRFVSTNGDQINELKETRSANNFQMENGEFSKYIFETILARDFNINEEGTQHLRAFNENELKVMYNDIGWDSLGKNMESGLTNRYFVNNIINYIGQNRGRIIFSDLTDYQAVLNLSDNDIRAIINSNGEIVSDNLASNPNYLRYAAFYKANWYVRNTNRWFSNDSSSEFYDRNIAYNSSLLNKYVWETKTVTDAHSTTQIKGTDTEVVFGTVVSSYRGWLNVDGLPDASVSEALYPGEPWMDEVYDWTSEDNNAGIAPYWTHTPKIARRNPVTNFKIYERLDLNEIAPEVLKNAKYALVNPLFLRQQGLKLGDTISFYTPNYAGGYETFTIIGTANAKGNIFNNKDKSAIYLPFQQIMKREWNPITVASFSIPKFKNDYFAANEFTKAHFYNDFQQKLLVNSGVNNFQPRKFEFYDWEVSKNTVFFLNLITYSLIILTLLLLLVVFYFITDQSIKLQKTTLAFLKSLGETNYELSLITTLSSLVPIFFGTILGIFASFGVSQILISVLLTVFPLYIPAFSINPWAWFALVIVLIIIFLMFLGMNMVIIRGPLLKLGQNTKVGLVTRGYLAIKPIFKFLPSKVRIGISFIAQNILKNILTFILLTGSFGVVLFSVEFRISSDSSAHAFEDRYAPYESVLFDNKNISDSNRLDFNFLETYFPRIREVWNDPSLDSLTQLFKQRSYYQGPITTYKISENNYVDVETGNNVALKELKTTSEMSGDQQFNRLIKNQIDEIIRVFEDTVSANPTEINFNPEYDLKDYYFGKEYTFELLTEKTSLEHAQAILNFTDEEINGYGNKIKEIIRTIEQNFNVVIFEGTDEELLNQTGILIRTFQEDAITGLTAQLEELKTAGIEIKTNFADFDFRINIYFNRDILPKNELKNSVMGTRININGRNVLGLGLDKRNPGTYQMQIDPLGMIPENDNDFSQTFSYYDADLRKTINVHAMDVYVSGNLADDLQLRNNQIVKVFANGFAYDNGETPILYLRILRPIRQASYLQEIYFNKVDLFNYLKINLEEQAKENEVSQEQLEQQGDYQFYQQSVNKIINNERGDELFNNSVFSLETLPYGVSNISLRGNFGTAYSLLSYTNLPIFNYASENYPTDLVNGFYVFNLITAALLKNLNPIIQSLDRFIILLLLVTLAVALILITLILLENKNVILLFKSLGYRRTEVNGYITLGYIISTVLAMFLGGAIAYFGIKIASITLVRTLQISLFFVFSAPFIVTQLSMTFIFIGMTLLSVTVYSNKQKPKNAFSDL